MGKKRKELSHAEVWDDTALLQSWDDALEEYKVCQISVSHQIHLLIMISSIIAYMPVESESRMLSLHSNLPTRTVLLERLLRLRMAGKEQ